MSEANNVWRVDLEGKEREIELEHTIMGKWTVKVDGQVIAEDRKWVDLTEEFDVDGHPALIKLNAKYGGFAYASTLHVDERYVEPLQR